MKKIIAVILCALMVLSLLAVPVFADEPLNYVVIGDSIARGAGIYNSDEACFGRIVADTNGYDYKNFGVDGLTSWQLLDKIKTPEVSAALADADIISISIGGNDYLQQNLPKIAVQMAFGNDKIVNDIKDNFTEHFADIIAFIRSVNPDAVIIAQTLYNPRIDLLKDFYGEATVRVNEVITDYAAAHPGEIELIDTVPALEGHPECIAFDTIHPSAVGNEELAKLVLSKLYELGLGENLDPVVKNTGIDQIPFSSNILAALKNFFLKIISFFTSL